MEMREQLKKFLNEEQDPKAIEKILAKFSDLLMKGEEVGYIGVQKKPAINVFPDSIILTNKRIIICKPKNLGLSMDFTDYAWDDIAGTFVKEHILGSEFSFSTQTDMQISMDYLPKIQARKIYTYAKEQMELLKTGTDATSTEAFGKAVFNAEPIGGAAFTAEIPVAETEEIEEVETEEVTNFAEIIPVAQSGFRDEKQHPDPTPEVETAMETPISELTQEQLFDKLQNYKKLLDNGLILQGEYDTLKKEILSKM